MVRSLPCENRHSAYADPIYIIHVYVDNNITPSICPKFFARYFNIDLRLPYQMSCIQISYLTADDITAKDMSRPT